ncbi:hypothetical protein [Flavivirga sp. 57AJ16]|uniref:MutS-related protein n=1 Tax=Flavivirga sp. 57AJ16 TaxID=3025307 RepID=UPI0023672440|nr:hypothetical protein [Flavivirga sp. 57AJ16]MDD7886260.1 hypothetical protein [Flavivirga sp. 57AJ16]
MGFVTDKQTLDDLNILGRYKSNSIFSIFNQTITIGGGRLLENMFQQPLTHAEAINERSKIFSFFETLNVSLPFDKEEFEIVENYLRSPESKNKIVAGFNITKSKLLHFIAHDREYELLREGLEKTIPLFSKLKPLMKTIEKASINTPYYNKAKKIADFLSSKHFDLVMEQSVLPSFPLTFQNILKFDYIFRGLFHNEIEGLLKELYELDVYITVSDVSIKKDFSYAKAVDKKEEFIDIKGMYHPCLSGAVKNDVHICKKQNVFFLTGANMAGKSTLMKSFGVAVYLAHMGFPVAASDMTFSIHEGIYTSINVPDNLEKGYSHFYAEVLRVKHVAEEVATNKQLVVIFDELFKGTNVKDASDGTIAIVDAFSKRNGTFIISTHIMEAGEALRKTNNKLFFKYLPTIVKGNVPTYTYTLHEGITDDRQGMMIIQNEKILDIINGNIN